MVRYLAHPLFAHWERYCMTLLPKKKRGFFVTFVVMLKRYGMDKVNDRMKCIDSEVVLKQITCTLH